MLSEGQADMEGYKIFDSHAHFDSVQFDGDRDALLTEINTRTDMPNVDKLVNVGANVKGSLRSVELAERYDFIYAAVGVHPDDAGEICYYQIDGNEGQDNETEDTDVLKRACFTPNECADNFRLIRRLAKNPETVAIGEIGLDYHWNIWPKHIQQEAFTKQWELALKLEKPVIIHSRDAAEDTMKIVKKIYSGTEPKKFRAVMHCYSYGATQAREYLDMGMWFGIGGVVTFSNAKKLKEVVQLLPLERIMLETDCPYMSPEPFRGKRNDSGRLTYVAEKIAEIKGITAEEVYTVTYRNAREFFEC